MHSVLAAKTNIITYRWGISIYSYCEYISSWLLIYLHCVPCYYLCQEIQQTMAHTCACAPLCLSMANVAFCCSKRFWAASYGCMLRDLSCGDSKSLQTSFLACCVLPLTPHSHLYSAVRDTVEENRTLYFYGENSYFYCLATNNLWNYTHS